MRSYYKAIPESHAPEHDSLISSDHWNYRMAIGDITEHDQDLFDAVLATSRDLNCTLSQAMQEAVGVRSHDPEAIPATHRQLYEAAVLSEAMGEAVFQGNWPKFSARFWEHLHERLRVKLAPDAPSRLRSFFACVRVEDVHAYLQLPSFHKESRQVLFEVVSVDPQVVFQADGVFAERANDKCTFHEAAGLLHSYWAQEISPAPRTEVLLQGSFRFKRLDFKAP